MAGTGQFTAYPIAFDGFNLTQHGGFDFNPGVQFSEIHLAGRSRRAKVIGDAMAAVYPVTTLDLLTILGKTDILKYPFTQAAGASFFLQQREAFAAYSSGANHIKILTRKGFLLLNSIAVDGTTPAVCNFEYHELWDGTNDMSVMTASETLGAAAPAFVSDYYRGTVRIDGTDLTNVQSVTIDTGIAVNKPTFGGEIGPTKASAEVVDPVIDVALAAASDWPAHSMKAWGKEIATSFQVYLKRGDPDDMREAAGESILISCAEGHVAPSRVNAQGTADGMLHLLFRPFDELAVNTGATHP